MIIYMDLLSIVYFVIIIIGTWFLYHMWLSTEQTGGGSIAPGVFDQLDDKGPMDVYLTGDMDNNEISPNYMSYGPPFFYPQYYNGPPYNYGAPDYFQAPFIQ